MRVERFDLKDDGVVPNHPSFPLVIYHDVFLRDASCLTADDVIEVFGSNGWSGAWVNGIFPFHHYHARSHEVLANLGGPVQVQFGGPAGPVITFQPGAAVVIPAGGGHCRLSNERELLIVGAYPYGQENWDLKRADDPEHYVAAKEEIAQVELPQQDPITGSKSPLLELWN